VERCDWTLQRKWSVIADWHLKDAIADNGPPAEELGKGLYDAWAWTDVEDKTATGVEAIADAEGRVDRRARSCSSDSWLSCAESVARSLDASVIFSNPPEKGTNNLCVSARKEIPAGGEKRKTSNLLGFEAPREPGKKKREREIRGICKILRYRSSKVQQLQLQLM
jgi:hypothetical protein